MAKHVSELWRQDDWRVRILALAIVAALPTAAGLLIYAVTNAWWIGADDRVVAIVSAALLTAGATAAFFGRTAGVLVMFSSACAAMGLATESMFRLAKPHMGFCGLVSFDRPMVEIALITFVPGAVAAMVAMAAFTPAMVRFLRRPA